MLMAPAYAVPRMLERAGLKLQDFDIYEIHEAFAAQVLCTLKAWESADYCKERLGRDAPLGSIDRAKLNPKGSSVALGHPFAATGARIVATLAKALAERGHQVHLVSTDPPFRLGEYQEGLAFHQVHTPSYPLFREPQYVLSLANKVVQVAREFRLDLIHAHYAIPHATAALLSRQVLQAGSHGAPRVVTTLHGTDITLVGSDPSYSEIVAFSIEQSDGVTAVSNSLRESTRRELCVKHDIEVIPNFLDCRLYRRRAVPGLRQRFAADPSTRLVIHVSNFRPVKRIDAVMEVFARISRAVPAKLLLVGDGPELGTAYRLRKT
jgi:N-acetyl-alpha-D-glucosaminyl L-malate synthase BshA